MTTEHPHDTPTNPHVTDPSHGEPDTGHRARPRFTLSEAATLTGTSRSTIRRRLDTGAFPQATKDNEGAWRIPVEDLLAAGLTLSRPLSTDTPHEPAPPTPQTQDQNTELIQHLKAQLTQLQAQIEVERAQRTAAEQVAAERAEHLDTARRALRMLEATPHAEPEPRPQPSPTPAPTDPTNTPTPPTGNDHTTLRRAAAEADRPGPHTPDPSQHEPAPAPIPFSENPFVKSGLLTMPPTSPPAATQPQQQKPQASGWRRFFGGKA